MAHAGRRWCGGFVVTLLTIIEAVPSCRAADALLISGAGSTFIYPICSRWFIEYNRVHPGVQFNYEPIGSGRGIQRVILGSVDFGASDGPMSEDQLRVAKRRILHFTAILGAVVPAYNLPEISQDLHFTSDVLAGIYLGAITKWNAPQLAQLNPGLALPAKDIKVVFRSDSSGTTYIWSDYLAQASPEFRKRLGNASTSVSWGIGVGAQFNEGVAQQVRTTPYALGYVELTIAIQQHLGYGSVRNPSGNFVKADFGSVSAAAASQNIPADFRVSIVNSSDRRAYPISSFSWFLVPEKIDDPRKRATILEFIRWILTDGQKMATGLNYAPLPVEVVTKELQALSRVQ